MQFMSSGTKPPYRQKRYGLSIIEFKLFAALCWGLPVLVLHQLDLLETAWVLVVVFCGLFVPLITFVWDERRAARLKQHDINAALTAIKNPLRSATQPDGRVVDFDPHYPTVSLGGGLISALDPRRRLLRMIVPDTIDAQGQPLDDTGPAGGDIVDVSQKTIPGKRRWLWLLPPRAEDRRIQVTVTSRGADGKELVLPFRFSVDDPAAIGCYQTFMQWMRDDRQNARVRA